MYVFGYGSLIWKVDFAFEAQVPCYIRGYVRRFWQGSNDHRGCPEKPGRVVTLLPYNEWRLFNDYHPASVGERCYGMAFKIREPDVERVKAHLDFRERNGYTTINVPIYHAQTHQLVASHAVLYIGTKDNEAFLGPSKLEDIAHQIVNCKGCSGPNVDYLLELCQAMRTHFPAVRDKHLEDLEREVLRLLDRKTVQKMENSATDLTDGQAKEAVRARRTSSSSSSEKSQQRDVKNPDRELLGHPALSI